MAIAASGGAIGGREACSFDGSAAPLRTVRVTSATGKASCPPSCLRIAIKRHQAFILSLRAMANLTGSAISLSPDRAIDFADHTPFSA